MELRYLYVGTDDTERDLQVWRRLPGAEVRWRFRHFGADVACIDLGELPRILLADHRPTGSVLPIYQVDDLAAAVSQLAGAGWDVDAAALGTPEGPAAVLHDASGTELALLQVERPEAMEASYADPSNHHAVPSSPLSAPLRSAPTR